MEIDRRQGVAGCEADKLVSSNEKIRIGGGHHRCTRLLCDAGVGRIDLAFIACSQHAQFSAYLLCCRLCVLRFAFGIRIAGIDEDSKRRGGRRLAQELQPLWRQCGHEQCYTRDITTRVVETTNQAVLDWVVADREDNRDGRGCSLCRKCGDSTSR